MQLAVVMLPIIYHPNYSCEFPEKHRFVMRKFADLYAQVNALGLLAVDGRNLFQPTQASLADLSLAHCPDYVAQMCSNQVDHRAWRRIGLPWSQGLVARTLTAPNGTLLTARKALQYGLASHLAGGTHHAHYDFGSGFCILNDLAYCAQTLLSTGEVNKLLIFDLDVHQGDGTAAMLAKQANAITVSIHCEKNFPFRKYPSDVDVGLPMHMQDAQYLSIVEQTLQEALSIHQPDLVLYDAGVDIWQGDALGHLDISSEGMYLRDELVIRTCLQQHIPLATVIGGGYDEDHGRLARRHSVVVEVAAQLFGQYL